MESTFQSRISLVRVLKSPFQGRGFRLLDLLFLLAIIVSLLPLTGVAKNFRPDWYNHLWAIQYYGRYLQYQGRPPDVFNVKEMVGVVSPVFYASKFYAALGLVSIPLGSALAFRLFAATLLVVQMFHVRRVAKAVCSDRLFRAILTFAVAAEVFRVITMYERGGLTEFTAVAFLTMSICTFLVLLLRIAAGQRDRYGLISTGLFYSISATIHPLTGVFGGILLGLLGMIGFAVLPRLKLLIFGLSNVVGAALMLGPWLQPVLRFGKLVQISNPDQNCIWFQTSVATSPMRILLSTLNPWSFGRFRIPVSVETYELNVQVSLALLILSIAGLILWRYFPKPSSRATRNLLRSVLVLSYLLGVICMLVFCSPGCSSLFGSFFDIMQFPYRLVAYVNLCLLMATLCLLGMVDWQRLKGCNNWRVWRGTVVVLIILIAAVGLVSKVAFIQSVKHFTGGANALETLLQLQGWAKRPDGYWIPGGPPRNDSHLDEFPATYFGVSDYEVTSCYRKDDLAKKSVPVRQVHFGAGPLFGSVGPSEIDLTEPTLLVTNVIPFPWNVINLDGREVAASDLIACPIAYPIREVHANALGLMAGPGHHVLSYEFRPDKYWPFLRDLSWVALMVWTALWAGVIGGKLLARKPAEPESSGVPELGTEPSGEQLPVLTH